MLERIMRPARPAIVACMFALGRNWTFDSAIDVSALPPKADMCGATLGILTHATFFDVEFLQKCLSQRRS
jgi:hypothetical protein